MEQEKDNLESLLSEVVEQAQSEQIVYNRHRRLGRESEKLLRVARYRSIGWADSSLSPDRAVDGNQSDRRQIQDNIGSSSLCSGTKIA